ncbi:E2 ubiquitin-conjugating enzyme [Plasmodiophora brassicae]|uniref:E2 ubiquitin-conjugating enzyme n=1 Tax=Plasmodiophora brassicae TaxID=37360 RepID=A0A0G4IXS4_PLABS|nr:hypothetical protein PBRA_007605 [Plasmodiophora brassicae]
MQAMQRVQKEFKEIVESTGLDKAGVDAALVNDDLQHWTGRICGPIDTPYQGGIYHVDIQIPKKYPFVPPVMKFTTKIWHPNISSQTGAICLDILKNEWSPALTIRTALLSLQALLSCPEPDDPQDAQVAKQYKTNRNAFSDQASQWAKQYAGSTFDYQSKDQVAAVKSIMELGLGCDEAAVRTALSVHEWDNARAVDYLMGSK